jgi:hypothetical protein
LHDATYLARVRHIQLLDATSLRKGGTMTVRKPRFRLRLEQIEISSEEILADLLYPAPRATPKATPKRTTRRPGIRA